MATPAREINKREDVKGEYLVELQWELNLDNEEGAENRCTESAVVNMSLEIKKKLIKRHLEAYDYVAALQIAGPIKDWLKPSAINLIKAGAARLKLDKASCTNLAKLADYKIYPVERSDHWAIFEYLMVLKIKIAKEEFADYLRAISPLFFVLMERAIKNSGFPLDDYQYSSLNRSTRTEIKRWRTAETNTQPIFEEITGRDSYDRVVGTEDYFKLINSLDVRGEIKALANDLRQIEKDVRNPAAHAIAQITDSLIKRCTGFTAEQIFAKIKRLTVLTGVSITDEDLCTYDRLNEKIAELLD